MAAVSLDQCVWVRACDIPSTNLHISRISVNHQKNLPRGNVLSTTGPFLLHFINHINHFESVVEYAVGSCQSEAANQLLFRWLPVSYLSAAREPPINNQAAACQSISSPLSENCQSAFFQRAASHHASCQAAASCYSAFFLLNAAPAAANAASAMNPYRPVLKSSPV